jgi:hypothetical protein
MINKYLENSKKQIENLYTLIQQGKIFESIDYQLDDLSLLAVNNIKEKINEEFKSNSEYENTLEDIISFHRNNMVKTNDYIPKLSDKDLKSVITLLGNPNPEFRDTGAFFFLAMLIDHNWLSDKQKKIIVDELSNDTSLLKGIDYQNNDFVFRRSFSEMVLSILINHDALDKQDYIVDKKNFILNISTYAFLENDTRGFVDPYGWIHAFTHIGGMLESIVKSTIYSDADKLLLFASTIAGYKKITTPLVAGEIDRLVDAIVFSVNNNIVLKEYFKIVLANLKEKISFYHPRNLEKDWNILYNMIAFRKELLLKINNFPIDLRILIEQDKRK